MRRTGDGTWAGAIATSMDILPYFVVLFAVAAPALAQHVRRPTAGWAFFYVVLLIFVGLRYQVGSDWWGYLELAALVEPMTMQEVLELGDPLFNLLLWISVTSGFDVYGANLVTSGIFLFGLFKYCRRMANPWLALYSALPFLVIVVAMSANRQAAAIGVTLYLLASWEKSSLLRRLVLLAVAAGFHTSAVVFLLLFVIDGRLSLVRKSVAAVAILAAAWYLAGSSTTIDRYTDSYIASADLNVAAGALQQILLNALPGLILLIRRRTFEPRIPQPMFLFPMAILAVALVPLALFYSVAAARLSFYLFPVSIVLLSTIPSVSRNGGTRNLWRSMVVVYGMVVLSAWLTLANHAYNHKPYGNLLLQ